VRLFASSFVCLVALGASGCYRTPIPMTAVHDDASPPGSARCLVVLLPGMGDDADDFRKKGFIDTIHGARLSADIIATNATFGYYMKGMMPERMFVDIVSPAQRARNYEQTWLIGVSMGGLGTLLSAQYHGAELSGVIAIAPYLGRDDVLDSIRASGGLDAWPAPTKAAPTDDNYDAQLWRFLKAALNGQEPSPPIYLGWGKTDRLRDADVLLGARLPKDHVFSTDGGHDWGPWNALLWRMLRETPIARSCAARSP
jgi:pimeloyl-ACP methyl ester carboxylesterase